NCFRMVSVRYLVVLMALIAMSNSCSCMESSPEKIYYNSDFVSKMRVDHEWVYTQFTDYSVTHLQIFKRRNSTDNASLSQWVYTAPQSYACGLQLLKGEEVILAGSVEDGQLDINSCSVIDPSFDTRAFQTVNCRTIDTNVQ
ncbi:hypothetical protein PENTCL1PPCAC_21356, partial [Pristionchus entomophagus]